MVSEFKKSIGTKVKELKSKKPVTAKEFSKMEKLFNFGLLRAEDLSLYQAAFMILLMEEYKTGKKVFVKAATQNKILKAKWNKKHEMPVASIDLRALIRLPDDDSTEWQLIFETYFMDKTHGPAFHYYLKGWEFKGYDVYQLASW